MAKIPKVLPSTPALIYQVHERDNANREGRGYLGCSMVGNPCDRYVWLSFRWAVIKKFSGRILRLFDTGHREEARVLAELKRVPGLTVVDRDPNDPDEQISVDLGCHMAGHLDAEVLGLPEAPKTWHVFDVKTIKDSKFKELVKVGFKKLFPEYYTQGMLYMHARGRSRAAFLFVNKDTDEMRLERFEYNKTEAEYMIKRGRRIALSTRLVEPIMGAGPDWYTCKMCDFKDVCHDPEHRVVEQNCRTCEFVVPLEDGTWSCRKHAVNDLPQDYQRVGCDQYEVNKDLAPQQRDRRRAGTDPRRPWKRK